MRTIKLTDESKNNILENLLIRMPRCLNIQSALIKPILTRII